MGRNKILIDREDNWFTKMGASFPGERVVFRGKDLFEELGERRWMQVLLFGITGREFTENQARLFEGIWVISASYPDPRIWNNRIASLAGTMRSTGNLAIAAAIATSEATSYGQRPLIKVIDFLLECKKRLTKGENLEHIVFSELKNKRMLAGFGRPIINGDERINPLLSLSKKLGFADGEYVKLVFEIQDLLIKSRYRFKMNIAALDAALAADQNFSPIEFYNFMTLCFSAGFFPCHIDASEQLEGSFYPYRCDRIAFKGIEKRQW